MICPKCGANIPDEAKFCEACGAALSQENSNYYTANAAEVEAPVADDPYKPGIKKREIVLAIVLSIVTCGIYGLIWEISLVNDLNKASDNEKDTNGITVLLLSIVTCGIYMIYWMYKAGAKVNYIREKVGGNTDSNLGIIYAILGYFCSIAAIALIQNELNKVAD